MKRGADLKFQQDSQARAKAHQEGLNLTPWKDKIVSKSSDHHHLTIPWSEVPRSRYSSKNSPETPGISS